jgi:thiol-disulfide isomerase/thioredoxin
MKKNQKLQTIIFLLLLFNNSFSQKKNVITSASQENGYTINIATQNLAKEKMMLYFTYGPQQQQVIVDTLTIKSNSQKVTFKMEKKAIGTIYKLKLASDSKLIELAIDNNTRLNLELDNRNIETIKCTSSNENKDFLSYQTQAKTLDNDKKNALRNSIITKYPNSILEFYLKIENKIAQNQPESIIEKTKYRNSFFNFMDKNDKRIYLLPNIYNLLYSYATVLPVNNENYTQNIDLLLSGIDCKSTTYPVYTKWILSNMNYFESKNLEKTYNYFYKKYIENIKCDILSPAEKSAEKNKVITSEKLPNFSNIPDFTMVDASSKEYQLSNIYTQNELTYVIFFSPTCNHCKETMPIAQNFLGQLKNFYKTHSIQVVTVLNDDDELALWSKFITDYKIENWINLKSTDQKKKYQDDFNAHGNPDFFLIDSSGKILLKSFNPYALADIFKEKFIKK